MKYMYVSLGGIEKCVSAPTTYLTERRRRNSNISGCRFNVGVTHIGGVAGHNHIAFYGLAGCPINGAYSVGIAGFARRHKGEPQTVDLVAKNDKK